MTDTLHIEICPNEPRASAYLMPGGRDVSDNPGIAQALADCRASGDIEPACRFVRDSVGVEWRIVARDPLTGEYENRLATDDEKAATARAIYFDSECDFTDSEWSEMYLIWDAAHGVES